MHHTFIRVSFPMLAMKGFARVEICLHLFLSLTLDGGKWSASCPSCFISSASAPFYALNKRLGEPQGQSRGFGEEKICSPSHTQVERFLSYAASRPVTVLSMMTQLSIFHNHSSSTLLQLMMNFL